GLEMVLEAGHARGAVADHLAHHGFLAVERPLRQLRPVERARELRLGVADAARLIEQPHAQKLSVFERRLLARCARQHPGKRGRGQRGAEADAAHRAFLPPSDFWQAYDRPPSKGSALATGGHVRFWTPPSKKISVCDAVHAWLAQNVRLAGAN